MTVRPVTRAQLRLLIHHTLEPDYVARMSVVRAWEFPPDAVDVDALATALGLVVARHDALRSGYRMHPEPHAVVHDMAVRPEVRHVADRADALRWITEFGGRPFDIAEGPLLRCLVAMADEVTLVAVAAHHLVCDGRALAVLIEDLTAAYRMPAAHDPPRPAVFAPGPPPEAQFHDVARAEARRTASPETTALIETWRAELAGLEPLDLPLDFPRPAGPSGDGAMVRDRLPDRVAAGIRRLSADGVTPFMVGLAAFGVLLSRYSGARVIPVGIPVANRSDTVAWRTVGCLVNTAVVGLAVDADESFRRLVRRCREAVIDVIDREHVPFDAVVAAVRPDRSTALNPLYQVTFAAEAALVLRLGTADGGPVPVDRDIRMLDLSATLVEDPAGYTLVWHYDTDLYERGTAEAMARSYVALLERLTGDPDARVRSASAVHPGDRRRLLAWSGQDQLPAPREASLVSEFARAAAAAPDATAVVDPAVRLTYAELNGWSDAVAASLVVSGVRPGDIVGVSESRSHRFPVAVLGILKAGAAYLPLDPEYPSALRRLMARDAGVRLVVGAQESDLGALPDVDVVRLGEWTAPPPGSAAGAPPPHSGDGAYVIYTSGSTGTPKGVMVPHGAVVAALDMWREYYALPGRGGRFPMFSSSSFDQSVGELTRALCQGGELHICTGDELRDPDALVAYLGRADPYMLDCVPAILRVAAGAESFDAVLAAMSTKVLTLGGERWSMAEARRFRRGLPDARLSNVYGLTECTVDSVGWPVDLDHTGPDMPIGRPLRNSTAYVLDSEGRLAPPGAVGELYLGGRSLAWGYVGRPALTAERFVPSPFGPPGDRLYRTGDRCRVRADGNVEFLGRADRQVKIRGFRVEIGEVEAAVSACAGVEAVHVAVAPGRRGNPMLVAYVVAAEDVDIAPTWERLPAHMVPARVVRLDALPTLANGKIDEAALPVDGVAGGQEAADDEAGDEPGRPDRIADPFVRRVAEAWSAVLGVPVADPDASFFVDLGGTSLLAVQAVTEVRRTTGRRVPFAALFNRPALGAFAEACLSAPPMGR